MTVEGGGAGAGIEVVVIRGECDFELPEFDDVGGDDVAMADPASDSVRFSVVGVV